MSILPDGAPLDPFAVTFAPIPMAEFRERVLVLYRPPLRSRTTFLSMRRTFDLLEGIGGVETTADLTTAAVARFVASRAGRENPNTTRTHLRKLSAACGIAHAEGWIRVNPFKVRRGWVRGVTPKAPRVHSREELARVLALAAAEVHQVERLYPREVEGPAALRPGRDGRLHRHAQDRVPDAPRRGRQPHRPDHLPEGPA